MWAKLKRQVWQWRGILIAAPSVAAIVIGVRFTGFLQLLELAALDQMFLLRPSEAVDPRIVIVEITESDVQKIGRWPILDAQLAQMIDNLRQQKPRAIGLDMYRDLPVAPGTDTLTNVFETTPNLIGVQKIGASVDSSPVAPPPVLKKKDQVGSNDLLLDGDGKVRRGLLYLRDKTSKDQSTLFSFAFRLALLYLEPMKIQPELTPDNLVKLDRAVFPVFGENDGGYVRAEAGGYQVILNYRGSIDKFRTISATDVLENRIPADLVRDRIVFIGSTAESLKDLFYTPLSGRLVAAPKRMAGVAIHANLTSQILSSVLDNRPLIRTWPEPFEYLWILAWATIGASLSWQQRYSRGVNPHAPWTTIMIVLAGVSLLGGSYLAFLSGWWIPTVPPMLALLGSTIGVTAYIARTAGEIRKTFGRYLTSEVVATLLESPEGLKLGGERRKITILTSDIRGFTAVSERLPAEEVIKIINLYLGYMADVITHYQGTIDEFMGDGILVLFGAPTARDDDPERAIACAVAMQLAMTPVNEKMQQLGLPQLEMGIGINTGEVVVGNIGSEKRSKYGVVGDQVNLTYRIESYTVGGQILVSESTMQEVGSIIQVDGERQVQPKGVKQPITIYDVGGIAGAYNMYLTKTEEDYELLADAIPLQYAALDGKHIDSTVIKGHLIKLSAKGAEVQLARGEEERMPAPLTNLKLNLINDDIEKPLSEDIYAKVLERPAGDNSFYIRFTEKPPDVEARFKTLLPSMDSIH